MKTIFRMVCLGLLPLLCLPTLAVDPRFWTTSSFSDFSKGTLRGLSLRQDGTLALARQFDSVLDSDQALIWSAAYDGSRHLYVATGHQGKVFRIDESGKSSLFFDSAELDVLALALDAGQNVYAATSPNGKVYKISSEGEASVFFDPDDRFIWDLAFGPDGALYVATGSKGRVFKVSPEGEASELYDTGQTNVICLAVDPENHLLAGSDPKGYVYRIAPDGKAFVLFDTGMNEVHDIQVNTEGEIYLIAVNGGSGPGCGGADHVRDGRSGSHGCAVASRCLQGRNRSHACCCSGDCESASDRPGQAEESIAPHRQGPFGGDALVFKYRDGLRVVPGQGRKRPFLQRRQGENLLPVAHEGASDRNHRRTDHPPGPGR